MAWKYLLCENNVFAILDHSSGVEETASWGISVPGVQFWTRLSDDQYSYSRQVSHQDHRPLGSEETYPHWFRSLGPIDNPNILSGPRNCDVEELKLFET